MKNKQNLFLRCLGYSLIACAVPFTLNFISLYSLIPLVGTSILLRLVVYIFPLMLSSIFLYYIEKKKYIEIKNKPVKHILFVLVAFALAIIIITLIKTVEGFA